MAQNIGGGASLSYRYFTKRWLWMWFSILVSQCFLYTRALNFLYVFFLHVILPACQADIISPASN